VFDHGRLSNGLPYLVMEHLRGEDLSQVLERGPVPVRQAIGYVLQVCEALGEAHAAGVVHRDLKPSNLFLAERTGVHASVKVLDFGISKWLQPDLTQAALSLTNTNDVMGSPLYMSPEQVNASKEVDERTDIWSLGVILYELVTGETPFAAATFSAVAIRIATAAPKPIDRRATGVTSALESVIMRCLAKPRAERYPSVAALANALMPLVERGDVANVLTVRASAAATIRGVRSQTVLRRSVAIGGLLSVVSAAYWVWEVSRQRVTTRPSIRNGAAVQVPVPDTRPTAPQAQAAGAASEAQVGANEVAAAGSAAPERQTAPLQAAVGGATAGVPGARDAKPVRKHRIHPPTPKQAIPQAGPPSPTIPTPVGPTDTPD